MESLIKICPTVLAVEMTQTHGQTDRHTDTLGSIATYSVTLTEYKSCYGECNISETLLNKMNNIKGHLYSGGLTWDK